MDLSGSDDDFAFVMFAFVVTIMVAVFAPSILRFFWSLHSPSLVKQNFKDTWEWLVWGPKVTWLFLCRPSLLIAGARALFNRRSFTWHIIVPLTLRKVIRIKIIIVIVFFFLLSVVLYKRLSFDPYEILGVTSDDKAEIKKQFRRLSMMYHPDKNSSAEAKVIYANVKRAFKMLTDPNAYEEEMASQGGVGDVHIGLPQFLMSKEYRIIAAPLLLIALFVLPFGLLWKLLYRDTDPLVPRIINTLLWTQEQYHYFYHLMGEPLDMSEGEKPEDIMQRWHLNNADYDVGLYFVRMCNEHLIKALQKIPQMTWRIRTNQQYYSYLQQYIQLHAKKQETLNTIKEATGPPKKPLVTALQTTNKRISQFCVLLREGKMNLKVPAMDEEEIMALAQQQQMQMQQQQAAGRGRQPRDPKRSKR